MGRLPWWLGYWAAIWTVLLLPRSRSEVSPRHDPVPLGPDIAKPEESISPGFSSNRERWTQMGAYLDA